MVNWDWDVTEVSIAVRLGGLVLWYCIDPHMAGWRYYRRDDLTPYRQKVWDFREVRSLPTTRPAARPGARHPSS